MLSQLFFIKPNQHKNSSPSFMTSPVPDALYSPPQQLFQYCFFFCFFGKPVQNCTEMKSHLGLFYWHQGDLHWNQLSLHIIRLNLVFLQPCHVGSQMSFSFLLTGDRQLGQIFFLKHYAFTVFCCLFRCITVCQHNGCVDLLFQRKKKP